MYKELSDVKEEYKIRLKKAEEKLQREKEMLFAAKDIYAWECDDIVQLESNRVRALEDKKLAFQLMKTKETQEVERLRDEMHFMNNQCWDEIRRVNADNSFILREKLHKMGDNMCKHINADHANWADFLSNFVEKESELHGSV